MTPACPAHVAFDPFAADYLRDPYPHLARVRDEAPVFHAPELDMWVVTRYADVEEVFADPNIAFRGPRRLLVRRNPVAARPGPA